MATLTAGGVALPDPVSMTVDDEIIWSSNTGRSAESGKMLGDVVTKKKTFEIKWGLLTAADAKKIATNMKAGFFALKVVEDGETKTYTVYRSSITKEALGYVGGTYYYKSVSVSAIEQ